MAKRVTQEQLTKAFNDLNFRLPTALNEARRTVAHLEAELAQAKDILRRAIEETNAGPPCDVVADEREAQP